MRLSVKFDEKPSSAVITAVLSIVRLLTTGPLSGEVHAEYQIIHRSAIFIEVGLPTLSTKALDLDYYMAGKSLDFLQNFNNPKDSNVS